jgi:hypothetical protein
VAFEERRQWDWAAQDKEQGSGSPTSFTVVYVTESGATVVEDGNDACPSVRALTHSPASVVTPATSPAVSPTPVTPAV